MKSSICKTAQSCTRLSLLLLIPPFISLLVSCESNTQPNHAPTNTTEINIEKPEIDLAKPLVVSKNPKDLALCKAIDQTIDSSAFANARWGVIAIGLKNGRVACARDAQKLFNPASILKLLTSIVALDKLGSEFTVKTSLLAKDKIEQGTLKGNLILYGRGAPDFDDSSIAKLVSDLKKKGLNSIEGDIIGDESYFKGDGLGDGWTWNAAQWYYGAAASALSVNRNQITVSVQKGAPKSDSRFVELSGRGKRN